MVRKSELVLNVGDTRPAITATLTDGPFGTGLDLTSAAISATLIAASGSGGWTRTCSGTNTGVVTVPWQPGDTAMAGFYWLQFQVTWPDGGIQSFPAGQQLVIRVVEGLAVPSVTATYDGGSAATIYA